MKPLQQFVNKHNITMAVEWAESNPNAIDWDMSLCARPNHYKVTLFRGRQRFTTHYTMGAAYCREPEAKEVIDSLRMDWETIENSSGFESWASDLGYDTDSLKALKSYKISQRLWAKFARFMGAELLAELEEYERL